MERRLWDMSGERLRRFCGTWRGGLALAALCLAVYLPGFFTLPAVDRDEARFAQASRQMAQSGDWVVPRVQDRPRLNKPPLIYWAQASSMLALTGGDPSRDAIWMYRLPSLLAAVSIALLTWRLGGSMFDGRVGLLAGAFIGVAPVVAWEASQARADMVMVAFTTMAMLGLWRLTAGHDRGSTRLGTLLMLWLGVALGILTKGPITPMVAGLAALVYSLGTRRWRWMLSTTPIFGLVIVLVACVPWVVAVMGRVGADVYWRTVIDETLGRSVSAREGHWGPPGYHALLVSFLLLPGSLCLGAGLWRGWIRWRSPRRTGGAVLRRSARAEVFLFAWVVPSWIVFEMVGTKLPHYTMPLYPALALLSARAVLGGGWLIRGFFGRAWARVAAGAWNIVVSGFSLVAVLVFAGALHAHRVGLGIILAVAAGLGVGLWQVWRALEHAWRRRRIGSMAVIGVGLCAFSAGALVLSLGNYERLWISRGVMKLVEQHDPKGTRPMAAVGFQEDSLIYESGGRAQRVEPGELPAWLARNPGGLVVIEDRLLNEVPALTPLGAVLGYNYAKGRWTPVTLAEVKQ